MNKRYDDMVKYAESINKPVTNVEICKAMASLGKIFSPNSILEPNSGMGEILYYCDYGYAIDAYTTDKDAIVLGRDVDNRINFIKENFLFAHIDKKYDLIISQIPFTYGSNPVTKREEFKDLKYLEKILNLLETDGVFIGLLPGRFFYDDYSLKMRKRIMRDYSLEIIIELPYEKYKVSSHDVNIAVVKNKTQRDNVFIVDYNENIEEIIHRYFLGEGDGFISKDLLSKRWNKYYHSSKFNWLNSYKPSKFISLGEVAKILCGPLTNKSVEKGSTIIVSKDNLVNGRIVPTVRDKYAEQSTVQSFGEYVLQDDDIVVNIPMDGYCNVARYDKNTEPAMVQFPYYLIRSKDEYFKEFMRTRTGISFFEDYLTRQKKGPTKVIYIEDVENFKIPILDLEDLKLVEKKYTDSLNEEDIWARLISIKLEIEENRKDRENYYDRIKELDKGIELRKKDSVSKDREIELLKRDKESLERSLLEKDEEKKELEERIRLYKEITPEDNELIIKTINELVKELREEIHLSKLELSTEIKKVDKRVAGVEKDMVEVKETMEKYGRLVEEIHSIVNKLYDIQGDILMKLNKTPNEGREELYVELSNRIWELINTNYEIKKAQAYDKIVEEYIEKFTERGWEKLDEYTRTYLVTARVVYEDLKYNDKLDFSPSCIALTKALERELFIHLFNRMIEYFQRDKNRNLNHLPDGIIHNSHRGPKYQKEKYYSLGKIPYILALKFSDRNISNHDKKKKEESLNEFLSSGVFKKDCFRDLSERDGYIKELGSKVSDITNKYRNEAAHKDRVDKIKAIECYDLIIETEQILIEFINKLA